jgi:hypothetical protein
MSPRELPVARGNKPAARPWPQANGKHFPHIFQVRAQPLGEGSCLRPIPLSDMVHALDDLSA